MRSPYLPPDDILIHGLQATIKHQNFNRPSQIVKHSRFLRNLEVVPLPPSDLDPHTMLNNDTEGAPYEGDMVDMEGGGNDF
jgi:hypothetical protein